MPTETIIVLAGAISVFGAFMLTLAWAAHFDKPRDVRRPQTKLRSLSGGGAQKHA